MTDNAKLANDLALYVETWNPPAWLKANLPAILAALRAAPDAEPVAPVWFIERRSGEPGKWLQTIDTRGNSKWTDNPRAVLAQYQNKAEAQAILDHYGNALANAFPTEHVFLGSAAINGPAACANE